MKTLVLAITAAALMTITFASAEAGTRCTSYRVGNTTYTNCY